MANDEHVAILKKGVAAWNKWRNENPNICPDLRGAKLIGMDLTDANLRRANLSLANLMSGRRLCGADLRGTDLRRANLDGADLRGADLRRANLDGADLADADLRTVNLGEADLTSANLQGAILVDTDLTGADLTGCRIFGVSAWRVKLDGTEQQNLVITGEDEPTVSVDSIEVAQFIYLMLNNRNIQRVIDTITSKVVLILGRFTDERKVVLDALREELRKRDFLPILFDFNVPATRDITETISLLARMARFVVADITDAKSIPAGTRRNCTSPAVRPCAAAIAGGQCRIRYVRAFQTIPLGPGDLQVCFLGASDR